MMRRIAILLLTILALALTTPLLFAQGASCYPAALAQTDSLRAETYRKSATGATLAPRATVVRRLANRIDSIQVGCVVVPPPPKDSTPRDTTPTPGPTPTPTPVPVPLGRIIQLDPSQRFQVMTGWRSGGFGMECPGYTRYRDALLARVVNDLNITHRSIELRSGAENPVDYYAQFKAGLISDSVWRTKWFTPTNDNADPQVTDSAKFHWTYLDEKMRAEIVPWRAAVIAAGKRPTVTLVLVDFKTAAHGNLSRPLDVLKTGEEYAELVTMAFLHLRATFGWVPDVVEVTLEPENSQTYGPDIGRAIVAARRRLAAKGFTPEFMAPSNVTARNTAAYMRDITAAGAAPEWVSWHRYIAPRPDAAVLAALRAIPGKKGMTEYNETNSASDAADLLFDDITQAEVGTWTLFLAGACGTRDNPENKGALLQVNVTDSLAPKINDTYRGVLLRQVYGSVLAGARRIGAAVGDTSAAVAAFVNPGGGVVVTLRARVGGTYTVKGLPAGTYAVTYALAQSLARVTLPTITKADAGDVQVTIPGNGVLAIVGTSGAAPALPPPDTTRPPTPPVTPPSDTSAAPLPPAPSGLRHPELPRTTPAYPLALHSRPCTDRPTTAAQLQTALGASGARVICLAPGLTFLGTFDINARAAGDTAWSVLKGDLPWQLGTRLTGVEAMPRLVAGTDTRFPALWIHKGAARWLVQGVEITSDSTINSMAIGAYRLALIEVGERTGNTATNIPRDIHFAHVNVHGWLRQQVKTGVYLNAAGVTFRDGVCAEIHVVNADSQCLLAANAPGPFLYENNRLEAASENIMFGGGDPSIPGVVPCDATIRGNLIRKPLTWQAIGTPTQSGSYLIKLLIEAKNACRVLVERNRLDGSWLDGQTGYAIGLKSVNQDGACHWCRVTDWTIRDNTIVHVGAAFGFAGRPEKHPVDTALSRVLVTGNWIDSLNLTPYTGDARALLLGWEARDIQFVRNTWADGRYAREAVILSLRQDSTGALIQPVLPAVTGFRFEDNVLPIGTYGIGATMLGEGNRALASPVTAGTVLFLRNAFVGAPRNNYPATTTWHATLAAALASGAGAPTRPVP